MYGFAAHILWFSVPGVKFGTPDPKIGTLDPKLGPGWAWALWGPKNGAQKT